MDQQEELNLREAAGQAIIDRQNNLESYKSTEKPEVDLSTKEGRDQSWDAMRAWRSMPEGPEREEAKNQWYLTYHNKTSEQYEEEQRTQGGFYPGANNLAGTLQNTFQGLSVPGMAYMDFATDLLGNLPGGGRVDDAWDEATRFKNPIHQGARRFLSVVLPTMHGSSAISKTLLTSKAPALQKGLIGVGAYGLMEAAVIGASDEGEEDTMMTTLVDQFPGVFGQKGIVPAPNFLINKDSDDTRARKERNMWETAGLSVVGSVLGFALQAGKPMMKWFKPLDKASDAYKAKNIAEHGNPETLLRIAEIDEALAVNPSKSDIKLLKNERLNLVNELSANDNLEEFIRRTDSSKSNEINEAATRKLNGNLDTLDFDPDVIQGLTPESINARQSVPPGHVARNMADVAAIKSGMVEGDPAPIITESMRRKGLRVGSTSRGAVMGVAESAREAGNFNAVVDGLRFTAREMDDTAWQIYKDIIHADNVEDVKNLFIRDKDVKHMANGKFNVKYINEEQARASAFALRDLTDRWIGRDIATSSARVMDTLGREVSTISEATKKLAPAIDENRATELIIEKMEYLMSEYGLNKYISGWQLKNKNWFDRMPAQNADEVLTALKNEFIEAENTIHANARRFTQELSELSKTNPEAMRPLMDAFELTNGDVDSLAKLRKWAEDKITPLGLLKSPNPNEMNLFARGAWATVYNNVLSGVSALRAVVGNTKELIVKPANAFLGHGIWGLTEDFEGLRRSFYYHGAVYETNRRALKDMWTTIKKVNNNPDSMLDGFRKDFVFKEESSWDILENMRDVWVKDNDFGRVVQYDTAKLLKDWSKSRYARYGMTGMMGVDAFTNTHIATHMSRLRAYDDVFTKHNHVTPKLLESAEKKHYRTMFDKTGLLTDDAAKNASSEVALNLDDGLATWINRATTAYPFTKHMMMFPRTASNNTKLALSYTPISLIPGINKYAKTIWARTDEEITAALAEHGINFATTPNARAIFKNLRAEYTGRVAFSSILTKTLWDYAMAGNLRGNGHYNASRRMKERNQMGYEPKTINLFGNWVSYKGIPGVDQVLSMLGDMSYYSNDLDQTLLEDWQAKLMWTISASFLNETPLQGIEPLVAAANGDLTWFSRFQANTLRSYIPYSGAMGVLSQAITSSQKDIHGDMMEYLMNRLPIASSMLPEQIDFWTGQPLNDIDNPVLRILNSVSPMKFSGTAEPWRQWLLSIGYDGMSRIKRDSTGKYEYSNEEREEVYKLIGAQEPWRKLERLMNSKKYADQIAAIKQHRISGDDLHYERIKLETKRLPIFREIDKILKDAQEIAEIQLLKEQPDIFESVKHQRLADKFMTQGDVEGAKNIAERDQQMIQELLQIEK